MTDLPIGYFEKLFAFDVETSDINITSGNPSDGCQIVSIGIIVLNTDSLEEIDRLYLEIKWNGSSTWSNRAENVHGLSKKYLEQHGISEEDAVFEIGSLIMKHWPLKTRIHALGHNLVGFDILFLKSLFKKFDMKLALTNRNIDTFSLMHTLLGAFDSDQGFNAIGLKDRTKHNAMEDIEMTVDTVRRIKILWKVHVGI